MNERVSMRALNLHSIGDIRYEEVARPAPLQGQALVRILASGVCGSDLPRIYQKGTYHFPTIPGHEFAGRVEEVSGLDEGWIGRMVAVFPLLPCRACPACQIGEWVMCDHYDYFGSRRNGGFAEYLTVPEWNLVPVPEGVTPQAAAMAEPAAVAAHALRRANLSLGEQVVIYGAGPIGLLLAQWVRAAGGKPILADIDAQRLDFARSLGFEHCIDSADAPEKRVLALTGGQGADLAIEGAGVSAALEAAVCSVRKFGRVVAMGNPNAAMALSQRGYWEILRKQLTVVGTWNSSFSALPQNDWVLALEAMADGRLEPERLITHMIPLADGADALEMLRDHREPSCKVILLP